MKNYDIDRILFPSLRLFLTYNYEAVSTSKLEEETGLTRGAIFFKFKNKEALFKAVIDKYVIGFQSESSHIETDRLDTFIELFIKGVESRMNEMKSIGINNIHRSYFNLLYQAVQYYPGFSKKITEIFNGSMQDWINIVSTAQKLGEIKQTCDIKQVAIQFRYIYSGMAFENSLNSGLDINQLKNAYDSLYKEIVYE